jgi:hypothetical protein
MKMLRSCNVLRGEWHGPMLARRSPLIGLRSDEGIVCKHARFDLRAGEMFRIDAGTIITE